MSRLESIWQYVLAIFETVFVCMHVCMCVCVCVCVCVCMYVCTYVRTHLFCPPYRHVARIGEERRGVYRILVGNIEGKRPLGIPRHKWEENIKMVLQEVECGAWTGSLRLRTRTGDWQL